MPKGYALCIGVNSVDPVHYQGWSGPLAACEFDARDMQLIAKNQGFKVTTLMTKDATRQRVQKEIAALSKRAAAGDIVMLTYAGHGGQLPDKNGDEADGADETWCLFDGEQVDDELYEMLARFAPGVRVLVFSDSCHSGTVTRMSLLSERMEAQPERRYRLMPVDVAQTVYLANAEFYDPILERDGRSQSRGRIRASCILISGCQDDQLSGDGAFNGRFTGMLKMVWNGGAFKGDYRAFHNEIRRRMPLDQQPNLFTLGDTRQFERETPFSV